MPGLSHNHGIDHFCALRLIAFVLNLACDWIRNSGFKRHFPLACYWVIYWLVVVLGKCTLRRWRKLGLSGAIKALTHNAVFALIAQVVVKSFLPFVLGISLPN